MSYSANKCEIWNLISRKDGLIKDGESITIGRASYGDALLVLNGLKKLGFEENEKITKKGKGRYEISIRRKKEEIIRFKSPFLQSFFEKELRIKHFIKADLLYAFEHDYLGIVFTNNDEGTLSNVLSQEDIDILTSIPTKVLSLIGFNLSGLNISRNFDDKEYDDIIERIGSDPQSYDCETWRRIDKSVLHNSCPNMLNFSFCDLRGVSFSGKGYNDITLKECDLDEDFLKKLRAVQKYVRYLTIQNKLWLNDDGTEIKKNILEQFDRKRQERRKRTIMFKKPEEAYSTRLQEKKKEELRMTWLQLKKYIIKAPLDLSYLKDFHALMSMSLDGFEFSQEDLDSISQIKNLFTLSLKANCNYMDEAVFTGGQSLEHLYVTDLPDMNILNSDELCKKLQTLELFFEMNTEIKNEAKVNEYIDRISIGTTRPACRALVEKLRELAGIEETEEVTEERGYGFLNEGFNRRIRRNNRSDIEWRELGQRKIKDAKINNVEALKEALKRRNNSGR